MKVAIYAKARVRGDDNMYTRTYNLDSKKYIEDIRLIKTALLNLNGVSEVRVADDINALTVDFDNRLSEKQILGTINQYKLKQ